MNCPYVGIAWSTCSKLPIRDPLKTHLSGYELKVVIDIAE